MEPQISFDHYYRVLRDISTSLRSDNLVKDVLDTLVRKSAEALNAQGAFLLILNLESHQLEQCASVGLGELGEKYLFRNPIPKEQIITDLCRTNKIIVIPDIMHDSRIQFPQQAAAEGFRMAIDAPLCIGDDIIGILRLYLTEPRELHEEELHLLNLIAEQGAFAIGKAQLLEGQRSRYDQLALQTEKLSALGRLAAGVAHEINNPLAGILLFSSNMLKKVPEPGPIRDGLELIVQETIRCKRIIQELLEFSRESEPNVESANLNDTLERALHILDNELKLRHIQLVKRLSGRLPEVLMDKNQIEQVVVNLLMNAVQAIEEQGVITISSEGLPGDEGVRVTLSDTGCGIPPENITRIFEPFFSTKVKGTGLGLAVSYGIIKKHQGRIYATPGPGGKGAVFTLEIPAPPGRSGRKTAGGDDETV